MLRHYTVGPEVPFAAEVVRLAQLSSFVEVGRDQAELMQYDPLVDYPIDHILRTLAPWRGAAYRIGVHEPASLLFELQRYQLLEPW